MKKVSVSVPVRQAENPKYIKKNRGLILAELIGESITREEKAMGSSSNRIGHNPKLRRGHDDCEVRRKKREIVRERTPQDASASGRRGFDARWLVKLRSFGCRISGMDKFAGNSETPAGIFFTKNFCGADLHAGKVVCSLLDPGLHGSGSSEFGFVRNQFERLAEQVFETVMTVSPRADQGIGAGSVRVLRCIKLTNRRVWSSGSPHHVRYGCRRDWRCRRRAGFASASRTSSRPRRRRFPPRSTPDE